MNKILTFTFLFSIIYLEIFSQEVNKNYYNSGNIKDSLLVSDKKQEAYFFADNSDREIIYSTISVKRKDEKVETEITHYNNSLPYDSYTILTDDWIIGMDLPKKPVSIKNDFYYENGNLRRQIIYNEEGNMISDKFYYEEGGLLDERIFNSKEELISIEQFDREGNITLIQKFEDEQLILSVNYYRDRKLVIKKELMRDMGLYVERDYYNGTLKCEKFTSSITNKTIGSYKCYYENTTQLHFTEEYDSESNKINIWKMYREDGSVHLIENYSANENTYLRQFFYPNGKLKKEGKVHKEDGKKFLFDKEVGFWKFYDENGKLLEEVDIENRQ